MKKIVKKEWFEACGAGPTQSHARFWGGSHLSHYLRPEGCHSYTWPELDNGHSIELSVLCSVVFPWCMVNTWPPELRPMGEAFRSCFKSFSWVLWGSTKPYWFSTNEAHIVCLYPARWYPTNFICLKIYSDLKSAIQAWFLAFIY